MGENTVVRVVGDGMAADCIRDGDYLILSSAEPKQGDAVVVNFEGAVGVGEYTVEDDGWAWVVWRGQEYSFGPGASVPVVGVLIGLIRKYDEMECAPASSVTPTIESVPPMEIVA